MSFCLNDALGAMGMPDLFDGNRADLSNMTGDKSLHVSAVIHKAFVEVLLAIILSLSCENTRLAGERERQ